MDGRQRHAPSCARQPGLTPGVGLTGVQPEAGGLELVMAGKGGTGQIAYLNSRLAKNAVWTMFFFLVNFKYIKQVFDGNPKSAAKCNTLHHLIYKKAKILRTSAFSLSVSFVESKSLDRPFRSHIQR